MIAYHRTACRAGNEMDVLITITARTTRSARIRSPKYGLKVDARCAKSSARPPATRRPIKSSPPSTSELQAYSTAMASEAGRHDAGRRARTSSKACPIS